MANWCTNFIHTDNQEVIDVFKELEKKEQEEKCGQTLDYFKDDRFLFNIYVDEGHITCETKWAPPIDTVINLAKKYNCIIEIDYDESGNLIYGKLVADGQGSTDTFLLDEDWDKFEYDEEKDLYIFEGKEWESDDEIKEILLERKLNGTNN